MTCMLHKGEQDGYSKANVLHSQSDMCAVHNEPRPLAYQYESSQSLAEENLQQYLILAWQASEACEARLPPDLAS
jgi:hypothetical protein